MQKLCYTIDEAQAEGAGGKTAIYAAIKSGALKARKRGNRTVFLAADLTAYLEGLPDFRKQTAP